MNLSIGKWVKMDGKKCVLYTKMSKVVEEKDLEKKDL